MRLTLVAVGRLKEAYWRQAADEYLRRLRPYATVREIEVPDRDVSRDEKRAIAEEGEAVLRAVPGGTHVVALDQAGTSFDSAELSSWLAAHALDGRSSVTFLLGGAAGLDPQVLRGADERLSLSRMTLPHQLARVVLLEQLYRAFKIERGEPYHR